MTDLTHDTQTQADSPESALANWQAQSAPLAAYAAEAQTALDETQQALGMLWEQAELQGDEQAKQMVSAAWQRAQQLHGQVTHMDAGLAGAGATISTLDEQRRAALDELKSIVDAIEAGDETHPELEDFAQEIRQDEYEYAVEQAEYYADDMARENLYEEIDQRICAIFGEVDDQTSLFVDFIYGNLDITPSQEQLFREFIDSLRDISEGEIVEPEEDKS